MSMESARRLSLLKQGIAAGCGGAVGTLRLSTDGRQLLLEQPAGKHTVRHRIAGDSSGAPPCCLVVRCGAGAGGIGADAAAGEGSPNRRFSVACTSCADAPPFVACACGERDLADWVIGLASLSSAWQLGASQSPADPDAGGKDVLGNAAQRQLLWQAARLRISELSPELGVCEAARAVTACLEQQRKRFGIEYDVFIQVVEE